MAKHDLKEGATLPIRYYDILAQAFDRKTGKPVANARVERADTKQNVLYWSCRELLDVKKSYESFWNDLPTKPTKEIVFVQSITPVTEEWQLKKK